jgi:hypothetical protein
LVIIAPLVCQCDAIPHGTERLITTDQFWTKATLAETPNWLEKVLAEEHENGKKNSDRLELPD